MNHLNLIDLLALPYSELVLRRGVPGKSGLNYILYALFGCLAFMFCFGFFCLCFCLCFFPRVSNYLTAVRRRHRKCQ